MSDERYGANSQEVRDPEGVEQISCTNLFLSVVLAQVDELEDIRMPWLKVDRKSARALVTTLVHITSGRIEYTEHRHNTIRVAVGSGDVGPTDNVRRFHMDAMIQRTRWPECYAY